MVVVVVVVVFDFTTTAVFLTIISLQNMGRKSLKYTLACHPASLAAAHRSLAAPWSSLCPGLFYD